MATPPLRRPFAAERKRDYAHVFLQSNPTISIELRRELGNTALQKKFIDFFDCLRSSSGCPNYKEDGIWQRKAQSKTSLKHKTLPQRIQDRADLTRGRTVVMIGAAANRTPIAGTPTGIRTADRPRVPHITGTIMGVIIAGRCRRCQAVSSSRQ